MKYLTVIKEEIFPNEIQEKKILETFRSCQFVYNKMLTINKVLYERHGKHFGYIDMQNLLINLKKSHPWLKDVDSQALQHSCRRLDEAFKRFFKKIGGYPKFKSKKWTPVRSYTTNKLKMSHITKDTIQLPKVGKVRWNLKRDITNLKGCSPTVSFKNGRYYVSILVEMENDITEPVKINKKSNVIGMDYKSDGLYVDNNGEWCDMPKFFRKAQKKLKRLQRKYSHALETHVVSRDSNNKPTFDRDLYECKNLKKLKYEVSKFYEHVANQRKDFLHKLSASIAKEYDAVCVEDMNMRSLSNKGFGNGKATLDNGWGMFLTFLQYKLENLGKQLVRVDKFFPSSQLCSECGYKNPELKDLSIREWVCPECGTEHDRDINAAVNIRNEGMRLLLAV